MDNKKVKELKELAKEQVIKASDMYDYHICREGKIKHIFIFSNEPTKKLPEDFTSSAWALLINAGIIKEKRCQVKFYIYDNEETVFYESESGTELFRIFQEVDELISNSYSESIVVNNDIKTGWSFVSFNNEPYEWEFSLVSWLEYTRKDLVFECYIDNPKNDNIWLVSILPPNMQHTNDLCYIEFDNDLSESDYESDNELCYLGSDNDSSDSSDDSE